MTTDRLTTILAVGQAIATAAVTFYLSESADGTVNFKLPGFWLGMVIAVFMAVKGYFTNKQGTVNASVPVAPKP